MKELFLALLFFIAVFSNGIANTIIVSKEKSSLSINEALELATNGDTILVKKGRYFENSIIVDKQVHLISKENATIDGNGETEDIFIVKADNVTISGFHLVNVGVSYLKEASAIRLVHSVNTIIEHNHIDSCFFGIYVEYGQKATIRHNKIKGAFENEASAGNAIHAWKGDQLLITNNVTTGHRDGIYFEFVSNSFITDNVSKNNLRYGLHFMFSNDDSYERNTFANNGAGVAVMFSRNIIMKNNKFVKNWGGASYGLLLKEISDGSIEGNHFIENTIGVLAEGANRLDFSENQFTLNGTAIDMKGNSLDNKIQRNNFIANTFEVVTNTKHNNNFYSQNYWSNYSGFDLDDDGYGDIPYRPVNLFAKVTNEVPSATFLLHSPFVKLMDIAEKIFPYYIPKSLVDDLPKLKPYDYD